ncbi:Leishmanolysin-like peptidase, partial [Bienertia sinuspersici]
PICAKSKKLVQKDIEESSSKLIVVSSKKKKLVKGPYCDVRRSNQIHNDCGLYAIKAMEWYDGENEKENPIIH